MDIVTAVIIVIGAIIGSLAVVGGVRELNRRKSIKPPVQYTGPYLPGTTETPQGRRARELDAKRRGDLH